MVWSPCHPLSSSPTAIYRVKVLGRDNFPERSGALLVCNHMSFVDVALLIASTDRPIRFLMYRGIYEKRIIKPFASMMKAIPISSEQRPREMIRSLRTASDALRKDEVVCNSSLKARSRAPARCFPSAAASNAS